MTGEGMPPFSLNHIYDGGGIPVASHVRLTCSPSSITNSELVSSSDTWGGSD